MKNVLCGIFWCIIDLLLAILNIALFVFLVMASGLFPMIVVISAILSPISFVLTGHWLNPIRIVVKTLNAVSDYFINPAFDWIEKTRNDINLTLTYLA